MLRNASGAVKRKVNEIFSNTLRESEKKELCTLIYYPEDKLELVKATERELDDWYQVTLNQLVRVCRNVSSKYTRAKVQVCHAGLECSIIGGVYPKMDLVSFGPTLRSPHTPNERCNIPSVAKFWTFLKALLKEVPAKTADRLLFWRN